MAVKVSSKYQVVIPQDVRTALDLKPGTSVEVVAKGGIAYLVPVPSLEQLRAQLGGRLGAGAVREKKDRHV